MEQRDEITECLDRFFDKKEPLKKKWTAVPIKNKTDEVFLYLYRDDHLILVFDLIYWEALFESGGCTSDLDERISDLRGLGMAKDYLEETDRSYFQEEIEANEESNENNFKIVDDIKSYNKGLKKAEKALEGQVTFDIV